MAEYLEREAVLNILASKNAPWDGYQKVADLRIADVVSKAAYDQVAWERNLAEEQLKSIGKSLGEKMDDVQPVKHGRWISIGHKLSRICSICDCDEPYNFFDDDANVYDWCPHCGAKMDGET